DANLDLRQSGRGGARQRGEQDEKAGQFTRHDQRYTRGGAKVQSPRAAFRAGPRFEALALQGSTRRFCPEICVSPAQNRITTGALPMTAPFWIAKSVSAPAASPGYARARPR